MQSPGCTETPRPTRAQQLGQVPEALAAAEALGMEGEAPIQQAGSLAGLEQEEGDIAPGGWIGGVAAAEQLAVHQGKAAPLSDRRWMRSLRSLFTITRFGPIRSSRLAE